MNENSQVDIQALLYGLGDVREITLPSGKIASVREMTGREQRSFSDRNKANNGTAINELLAACTDTLNGEAMPNDPKARMDIVNALLSGDRQALLFNIRRESVGTDFKFKTKCPNCKQEGEWEVDLNDEEAFAVHPYPQGDARTLEYDSTERLGLHFRLQLMDGTKELQALKKRHSADTLTDLELRVPQARDQNGNYIPVVLNKMGDKLVSEMRNAVKAAEGYQDTTVTVFCDNCQMEAKFDLLTQVDFMIPSATS